MAIRVSRKIDLPRVHWDESRSTIAGCFSTFSLTKWLPSVFYVTRHFKNFAQNQTYLICNKDDMASKTSTKMVVYTSKCICPGNIWWVFISRVNMRANIIWQSDFGKESLINFIQQFSLLCVNANLCYSFFGKYSLPKKHCSWELSCRIKLCAEHFESNINRGNGIFQ